ncbi:putative tetratricopeptide-like helical domain superfamily [Helianthus debilis subsp. tardiflorus]
MIQTTEVIKLYNGLNMRQHFKPSSVTVAIVLPVCVRLKRLMLGKSVHSGVIKTGLESQTLVGNSLVSMYLKLGCVYIRCLMKCERDVSWNAMVVGLMENGLVFGMLCFLNFSDFFFEFFSFSDFFNFFEFLNFSDFF